MAKEVPATFKIKRAVQNLEKMSIVQRLELMVKARLLTPEQLQSAKERIAKPANP